MHQQQRIARHQQPDFEQETTGAGAMATKSPRTSWVRGYLTRKANVDDADGVFVVSGDFVSESEGKEKERATNWSG